MTIYEVNKENVYVDAGNEAFSNCLINITHGNLFDLWTCCHQNLKYVYLWSNFNNIDSFLDEICMINETKS